MFGVEPLYFVVLVPGLVLALWAQWHLHRAFHQGKAVIAARSITGAQAAAEILQAAAVTGVAIEPVVGCLTDHYDLCHKVLRLSPDVYYGQSLAALGVAAHEAGHALQDATHYPLLRFRTRLVRLTSIGSLLFWLCLIAGFTLIVVRSSWGEPVLLLGLGAFAVTVLFHLVILPVEFDASDRTRRMLVYSGMVTATEDPVVQRVLRAVVMTHVATILTTALTLLCCLIRTGLLERRSHEARRWTIPGWRIRWHTKPGAP
jgi:Zn-dependent membrane protease YugP